MSEDFAVEFDEEENMMSALEAIDDMGYVHKSELRELVAEWREESNVDMAMGNADASDRWAQAANELEELIEDD